MPRVSVQSRIDVGICIKIPFKFKLLHPSEWSGMCPFLAIFHISTFVDAHSLVES